MAFPDVVAPISDGVVALRRFTLADAAAVTSALQDPEIIRWTASIPSPYALDDAIFWIERQPQSWDSGLAASLAIVDAAEATLLGCINVINAPDANGRVAIGYWVASWGRGRGVGTRALVLATRWAIGACKSEQLYLETLAGNVASERVAQKAGYAFSRVETRELTRRGTTETVQMAEWVWKDKSIAVEHELAAREPIFHRREFGDAREAYLAMTDDGFWEVGASGTVYDRDAVVAALVRRGEVAGDEEWLVTDVRCRHLAEETYAVTYQLDQGGRLSRRLTLWSRSSGSWKILYHQGTLIQGS